jgi:ketosteroid isomerase-like protein
LRKASFIICRLLSSPGGIQSGSPLRKAKCIKSISEKEQIMSEQENVNLVQQAYANFQRGDIQSLLGLLTDDIQWQLPDIENVPFAGKRQGREQVAEFFASLADSQDNLAFEPREFIAQGDKVVGLGRYQWRTKETGREYGGEWAHVFTVREGKIAVFHEYTDTAAAAAAFQKALSA